MNNDIRLSTNLFAHPKTLKLERRLGSDGVVALIRLWIWAAVTCPSGLLGRFDAEDIALAAGWSGDAALFAATLTDIRWLDVLEDGSYALHNWSRRQEYASKAEERIEKARRAAECRWGKSRDNGAGTSGPGSRPRGRAAKAPARTGRGSAAEAAAPMARISAPGADGMLGHASGIADRVPPTEPIPTGWYTPTTPLTPQRGEERLGEETPAYVSALREEPVRGTEGSDLEAESAVRESGAAACGPEAGAPEPCAGAMEAEPVLREPDAEAWEPEAGALEPDAEAWEPEDEALEPDAGAMEAESDLRDPDAEAWEPEDGAPEPDAEDWEPEDEALEPCAGARETGSEALVLYTDAWTPDEEGWQAEDGAWAVVSEVWEPEHRSWEPADAFSVSGDGAARRDGGSRAGKAAGSAGRRAKASRKKRGGGADLRLDEFDCWFAQYPRQENRKRCQKVWSRLARGGKLPQLSVLLDALGRQKIGWALREPRYVPMAATWLRDERWNDVCVPTVRPAEPVRRRGRYNPQTNEEFIADCMNTLYGIRAYDAPLSPAGAASFGLRTGLAGAAPARSGSLVELFYSEAAGCGSPAASAHALPAGGSHPGYCGHSRRSDGWFAEVPA